MDNPQMEQPNSSESALETSFFSKVGRVTDVIEESLIAFFLGAMTLLTFANVVFQIRIQWQYLVGTRTDCVHVRLDGVSGRILWR